jgi:signal peptidase II
MIPYFTGMKPGLKIILFCLITLAFIGCDRVTKDLAKDHLANRETLSYFHDTFRLQYAENTGAALNLGDNLSRPASFWLLSIFPMLLLFWLCAFTLKNASRLDRGRVICFALIFAGGIGNIIDRILFDRHVTDFMNLGIGHFRTGIFNVADMCVTAGVASLLYLGFKKTKPV